MPFVWASNHTCACIFSPCFPPREQSVSLISDIYSCDSIWGSHMHTHAGRQAGSVIRRERESQWITVLGGLGVLFSLIATFPPFLMPGLKDKLCMVVWRYTHFNLPYPVCALPLWWCLLQEVRGRVFRGHRGLWVPDFRVQSIGRIFVQINSNRRGLKIKESLCAEGQLMVWLGFLWQGGSLSCLSTARASLDHSIKLTTVRMKLYYNIMS